MDDFNTFEKEIRLTYHLPEADPNFFKHLETRLAISQVQTEVKTGPFSSLSLRWVYGGAILILIGIILFVSGPSKVLAQIQAAFGYVPGIGLVDTDSPFRQLSEPVVDTKDGVTLTIQSAFLSTDQTVISYTLSDLPEGIKRGKFGDPECLLPTYLVLPDGRKIESSVERGSLMPDGSFVRTIQFNAPLPEKYNGAVLVFPCLEGTARGKGPKDWQVSLAFKPASTDTVIYPATIVPSPTIPITPSPVSSSETPTSMALTETPLMPALIVDGERQEEMVLLGVVEKPDSYWVTWAFPEKDDRDIHVNGYLFIMPFNPVLYDANGVQLPPPDQETDTELWQLKDSLRNRLPEQDRIKYTSTMVSLVIPKTGVAFPVYAKQNIYERSFPEKTDFIDIDFDASKVLAADKPLELNREIQLGSVKFMLESVEKNAYGGFSFNFDGAEGRVVQCEIDVLGQESNMSGSGSFYLDDPFHFYESEMFGQFPSGKQTVRVSQPAVLGDLVSYIGSWSPGE